MGAIRVHEFTTVDGVVDAPMWTMDYGFPDDLAASIGALTAPAQGILLGRTTFEMFAPAWSTRTVEDDPGAPFFNDTTKYVVSSTLSDAGSVWRNSTAVGGYDAGRIRELKEQGDLYVSGSATLVRTLVADGLGFHIPKGYLYFAIAFSVLVEALNLLASRRRKKKAGGLAAFRRRAIASAAPEHDR